MSVRVSRRARSPACFAAAVWRRPPPASHARGGLCARRAPAGAAARAVHEPVQAAVARAGAGAGSAPPRDSGAGCFLQCVECGAVYAVEAEELDADSRAVQCALCRHEWLACERDLLWGAEHARPPSAAAAAVTSAAAAASAAATPDAPGEGFHIFVGNLSFRANEQDLVRAFAAYGPVRTAQIPTDASGASRGYGFVEMARKADGVRAMRALQGISVVGRDISLSEARPRREPTVPREQQPPPRDAPRGRERLVEDDPGAAAWYGARDEELDGRAAFRDREPEQRERGRERGRDGGRSSERDRGRDRPLER